MTPARMKSIAVSDEAITAVLRDGRTISVHGMLHGSPAHRRADE